MNRMILLLLMLQASLAYSQTTTAVTTDDPQAAIAALRTELVDSFNKADLPRLLSHLDEDVVVTWQNGEVSRGPQQVQVYHNKMMTGPDRRVQTVHCDPKVTDRHLYGDSAVSWGNMNDEFIMTDGTALKLDSRFTATIAKRGDVWKVTSFHLSGNLFDNEILHYAVKRTAIWTAMIAGAVGLLIGFVVAKMMKRKSV